MNLNYLFFAIETNAAFSFRLANIGHLVSEICKRHQLNAARSMLLGDAILGCVLMSSLLDDEEALNIRIQCESYFTIGVECNFLGQVKGYIECDESSELVRNLDSQLPWEETLTVRSVRTQKNRSNLFEGVTALKTNSIEKALNDHLSSSYQMTTVLHFTNWTNSKNKNFSFGLILQELPNIQKELSNSLKLHLSMLPSIPELYEELNGDPDLLSNKLILGSFKGLKSITPHFQCSCSTQKVIDAVGLLPIKEIQDILNKSQPIEVRCHYCNTNHSVNNSQIEEIFLKQKELSLLN